MATATKVRRGFKVTCLCCGEKGISIDPTDMEIRCTSCDETFTPASIQTIVGEWQRLLAWVETAPELDR